MKCFFINVSDFNLAHTLDCGQVFRWKKVADSEYLGVIDNAIVRLRQSGNRLYVSASDARITPSFITSYLDLTLDLPYIYNTIGQDKHIKAAIRRFYGLRIIRQPLWECVASFIISAYNNIPRIKGIIDRISACFGERIAMGDAVMYSFPDARAFANSTVCRLKGCGTGYRAEFLKKTAREFLDNGLSVKVLRDEPYGDAKRRLMRLKGVGQKVADCVLLYSAGKLEAFPVDVWMKRIMERLYFDGKVTSETRIGKFAGGYFGEYAGYAQQYLYHYGRSKR